MEHANSPTTTHLIKLRASHCYLLPARAGAVHSRRVSSKLSSNCLFVSPTPPSSLHLKIPQTPIKLPEFRSLSRDGLKSATMGFILIGARRAERVGRVNDEVHENDDLSSVKGAAVCYALKSLN